eukprot:Pgem_evm1s5783
MYNYKSQDSKELNIKRNDKLQIIKRSYSGIWFALNLTTSQTDLLNNSKGDLPFCTVQVSFTTSEGIEYLENDLCLIIEKANTNGLLQVRNMRTKNYSYIPSTHVRSGHAIVNMFPTTTEAKKENKKQSVDSGIEVSQTQTLTQPQKSTSNMYEENKEMADFPMSPSFSSVSSTTSAMDTKKKVIPQTNINLRNVNSMIDCTGSLRTNNQFRIRNVNSMIDCVVSTSNNTSTSAIKDMAKPNSVKIVNRSNRFLDKHQEANLVAYISSQAYSPVEFNEEKKQFCKANTGFCKMIKIKEMEIRANDIFLLQRSEAVVTADNEILIKWGHVNARYIFPISQKMMADDYFTWNKSNVYSRQAAEEVLVQMSNSKSATDFIIRKTTSTDEAHKFVLSSISFGGNNFGVGVTGQHTHYAVFNHLMINIAPPTNN